MSPAEAARSAAAVPSASPARPPSARPSLRPRLTVVPPLRAPAPRAPFVLLVGGLLCAGLTALLFLHTAIAEDSFRLHDLTARSSVLADREQALEQEIAAVAAPQRLASRAKALGMVRSENPAFIRISDGRILGRPKAGQAPPPRAAATPSPSTPASAAAPTGPPGARQKKAATGKTISPSSAPRHR
jgi:hypothetical protein